MCDSYCLGWSDAGDEFVCVQSIEDLAATQTPAACHGDAVAQDVEAVHGVSVHRHDEREAARRGVRDPAGRQIQAVWVRVELDGAAAPRQRVEHHLHVAFDGVAVVQDAAQAVAPNLEQR
jgi:hypothetical protein